MTAYGLVDNDGEDTDDKKEQCIYSLDVCAVESIYYDPFIQNLVAEDTVAEYGDAQLRVVKAKSEAMMEFSQKPDWGSNYESIIKTRPIKKGTHALTQIASGLGFDNKGQYETVVRQILKNNTAAIEYVKSLLGGLPEQIERDRVASREQGT